MSVVQSGTLSVPVALDMVNRVQRECGVEQITSMASGNDRSEVVREALNDSIIDLLSLIHISEPTRRHHVSRMPSSA